jgi:hypothetical protein
MPGQAGGAQLEYHCRSNSTDPGGILKTSFRFALTALLLACAGLAAAQDTAPAADTPAPQVANAAAPVVVEASAPAPAAPPQQRCRKEIHVGSNIPKTVCEPVETEAERQRALDSLQNQLKMNNSPSHGTLGHN